MTGSSSTNALCIVLYLAIPAACERKPYPRTPLEQTKRAIRRSRDVLRWTTKTSASIDFDAWRRFVHSNKGDTLIRETIRGELTAAFAPRAVRFVELEWGTLSIEQAKNLNGTCDLFVIGGGGYLFLDEDFTLQSRVSRDLDAFSVLDTPIVAYGIGVNRPVETSADWHESVAALAKQKNRKLITELMGRLDVVSVRDSTTYSLVSESFEKKTLLIGDPVFIADNDGRTLSARISGAAPQNLRVGLNFALHGHKSSKRYEKYFYSYTRFISELSKLYRVDLHYVAHSDAERVIPCMFRQFGIRMTYHDTGAEQLTALYSSFDFHICQMLHSSILSLSLGIPTINIGYDEKNEAFYRLLKLDDLFIPYTSFDVETALGICRNAIENSQEISSVALRRKTELQRVHNDFITLTVGSLGRYLSR